MTKQEKIEAQAIDWIKFAAEEIDAECGPGAVKAIWDNPEWRDKMIEMAAIMAHECIS